MALSTKSIPSVLIVGGANQVARVGDALTIEASGLASGCDGRSKAQRAVDYAWSLYRLDGVDDPEEDWTQLAEGAEFVTVGNCECTGTQGFDPWDTSGAECAAAGCVSYTPLNSFALEALEGYLTPEDAASTGNGTRRRLAQPTRIANAAKPRAPPSGATGSAARRAPSSSSTRFRSTPVRRTSRARGGHRHQV